jgi:hypothetical protein
LLIVVFGVWWASKLQATTVTMMIPVGRKDEEERLVSYLPLSHVAGMMVGCIHDHVGI